jgi:hypothetical protein
VQLKDVKSRLDTLLESTSISDDDDIEAGARVAICQMVVLVLELVGTVGLSCWRQWPPTGPLRAQYRFRTI